ncbi:NrfD/PsrC family molybdoenzyme membrane anchor subunit [Shewanella youngdeokensis]|uniref:NrfD/PsrC family molybdoenzyme membrane anchor subunit n=1 Tax=Shewanella youngdeokensis TaxID=2999068 RepID=A0ABZ0JX05_9GAMM|nr:NrfD/PsrC family molybdoenzyme membrane anchor subunit [Shewanella sp. DAU334]
MNNIWGSMEQYDPIVWHWLIAIYLFMAGLSAGSILVAIGLKWYKENRGLPTDGMPLILAASSTAPVAICVGMLVLVLDLTKPFEFYLILLNYNVTSVMSLGVIALLIYMPLVFIFSALVFEKRVLQYLPWLAKVLKVCRQLEWGIEKLLFVLALGVAVYTGFLLSALTSYPILNTAVLPALFLASALSVGSAANVLIATLFFNDTESDGIEQLHRIEYLVTFSEVLCLVMLFASLGFAGTAGQAATAAITTGTWAGTFWFGVVGIGIIVPVLASLFTSKDFKATKSYIIPVCCSVIIGVMSLRIFILYGGQSYLG